MDFAQEDRQFMQLALQEAARGLLITSPNPSVGCVLVKNGTIIGRGFTQPAGFDHAEIHAIKDAQAHGYAVDGATAYVTLEPCSHHGRTPPCAARLIEAGISRVVAAIQDPNPLVAGKGLALLKAAGVTVQSGLCEREARESAIGFFSRMQRGKPWVRMKVAASLDTRTALFNGQSKWITGEAARNDGHWWRARACAILTGIGTVNSDDPRLTARIADVNRQPRRIVVDSRLDITADAQVLDGGGTWIVAAQRNPEKEVMLRDKGAEILFLPNTQGKVDLPALMLELGRRQINELHVEAGAKLNGSLIREHCVDELLIYLAPSIIGEGAGMFDLPAISDLAQKRTLVFQGCKQIGDDLRILARFN